MCLTLAQPAVQQYKESGRGPLANNGTPVQFQWFSGAVPKDPLQPDLLGQYINTYVAGFNIKNWLNAGFFDPTFSYQAFLLETLHPHGPFGTVTLKSSNPQDTPVIDESPLSNDTNLSVLANGMLLIRSLWNQQVPVAYPPPSGEPPITVTWADKYGATEALPTSAVPSDVTALKTYIKNNSAIGDSISGTCRMGKKCDPLAVTDPHLKVRGVHHLRIVDASVFPTVPGAGLMVPVYAVAERAAKLILKD